MFLSLHRGQALLLLFVALLAPRPAPAAHPSLFYDASHIEALRQKARTTHQAIYQPLLDGTTGYLNTTISSSGTITWRATGRTATLGDRRDIGNSLVVFAFVSQLSTDSRYFELAKGWLMTVASWGNLDLDGSRDLLQGHLLAGASVAYDILAPRLTATEASRVRSTLSQNASAMMSAAKGGIWWADEYLQNHNWINNAAIGLAALATRGELPASTTDAWLAHSTGNARKVKALLDQNSDGTWHEGTAYAFYGMSWHLPFVSALKRVTGTDLGDLQWVRAFPRAFTYAHLPERPNQYILGHGDFYGYSRDIGLLSLRYAASRYRDPVAQEMANHWMRNVRPSTYAPELNQRVFEFLFHDETVPTTDLRTLPLDWYGADLQAAIFRSGWERGATLFALKNGPFGGVSGWQWATRRLEPLGTLNFSHNHADDNGFYLYGNGSWLAPEAQGYFIGHRDSPGPAANMTVFHNSLTIDGLGQLGEGVRSRGDAASSYSWFPERKGGIRFFGSSTHFGYVIGDGASLYPASLGLRRWDRHALFLDRKWVVLRDVVQSTASHVYRWSSHFMNGASREGIWLHGLGENGQALGVAVVAPTSFEVSITQQRPVNVRKLNPAGYVVSAEVWPTVASPSVTFLTALVPVAEAQWSSRPIVNAIDSRLPEAGVRLTEGTRVSLALFNDIPEQSRQVGSFKLNGLSAVVKYESGAPTRVLLVRGTSLADAARTLISQTSPTWMLEVDGLASDVLRLSGDPLGQPRVYAPRATRVLWNGEEVPFRRDGDHVVVGQSSSNVISPGTPRSGDSSASPPSGSPPSLPGDSGEPLPGQPVATLPSAGSALPRPPERGLSCATGGQQLALLWLGALTGGLLLRQRRRRLASTSAHPLPPRDE